MKKLICSLAIVAFSSGLLTAHAQFGGGPGASAPEISGAMKKLFGDNTNFTAKIEVRMKIADDDTTFPGKLSCMDGKSRLEIDMSQMKGAKLGFGGPEDLKKWGMDKTVMISLPGKKISYLIYPGLEAYVETVNPNPDDAKPASDFELKVSELGKETVDGHDCAMNKVEVTDKEGKKREFTVWNAADFKKFPIKIETDDKNSPMLVLFKDVKLDKPAASQFEPPTAYKKYDNFMAIMQQEMVKHRGNPRAPR